MTEWHDKYRRLQFKERTENCGEDYFDCWRFVQLVYKQELGIDLPSYSAAYDDSEDKKINALIRQEAFEKDAWREVPVEEMQEFDVILMQLSAEGAACHVGLAIRQGTMIHLRRRSGVVIQPLRAFEWKNRILGVMRYAKT